MHPSKYRFLYLGVVIMIDALLINAGYILAFYARFGWDIPQYNFVAYYTTWPWLTLAALALFYFYRMYGAYQWRWAEVLASLICIVFFQALAGMALSYFFRGFAFPRIVLLTAPLIQFVLLAVWRRAAWHWQRRMQGKKRVVLVGRPADAFGLARKVEAFTSGCFEIAGIVLDASASGEGGECDEYGEYGEYGEEIIKQWPVAGTMDHFCECLDALDPDVVIVCSNVSQGNKAEVVYACVARDKKVLLVPDLYEIMLAQARLEQVDDVPVFSMGRLMIPEESGMIKRLIDVMLSLAALAIALPVLIVAVAAIKIDSPGPVLYRQKRLTLQGKPFYLYKLRTMVANAEQNCGPVLAEANDPRVTRVGKFIRSVRIDELPQLFNVIKGDMSIIGPRPERPFFVDQFLREAPEYAYRMNVKSGITGLAQIAGRYSTSPANKLRYDLLYTRSFSLARDLAILLQTVKVILMKDRAS
jgi:exopolysaccharide biosynthesis polyprenyl glycosylphosphotransferase